MLVSWDAKNNPRDYGIESMRWRLDAKNNPRDPRSPLFEARDSGF